MNAQERIDDLKRQLQSAEAEQKNCQHVWGETKYNPIYIPGYTDPGDPPGTMGIDWRGPFHYPSKTEKRWTRICKKCGYEAHTNREETVQVITRPKF